MSNLCNRSDEHPGPEIDPRPVIIGGTSLAGRRWGPVVSGWLVGMPLTSGPVLFFLALSHDSAFTASAALGTLSGGLSLVVFCLSYSWLAVRFEWPLALTGSILCFAAFTTLMQNLVFPLVLIFILVVLAVLAGLWLMPKGRALEADETSTRPMGHSGSDFDRDHFYPSADRHCPVDRPTLNGIALDHPALYRHFDGFCPPFAWRSWCCKYSAWSAHGNVLVCRFFSGGGALDQIRRDHHSIPSSHCYHPGDPGHLIFEIEEIRLTGPVYPPIRCSKFKSNPQILPLPARRTCGGSLIEAEDGRAPGPAVPELLVDPSDLGQASHLLKGAQNDQAINNCGGYSR